MSKKNQSRTKRKDRSLRWKIVIMSIMIVLVAIVVAGGFILYGMMEYELDAARDNCRRMARAVSCRSRLTPMTVLRRAMKPSR